MDDRCPWISVHGLPWYGLPMDDLHEMNRRQAGNFVDLNATRARMRAFAASGGTISCDSGPNTAAGVLVRGLGVGVGECGGKKVSDSVRAKLTLPPASCRTDRPTAEPGPHVPGELILSLRPHANAGPHA
jgi:hypothetical protein